MLAGLAANAIALLLGIALFVGVLVACWWLGLETLRWLNQVGV